MSKQNKETKPVTSTPATAPASPSAAPPVEATSAAPAVEETALATVESTDVVADVPVSALLARYRAALPQLAQYMDQAAPPRAGELAERVAALSEKKRTAFENALARMNPTKLGQHTTRQNFRIPEMRVFQGTGKDELRPQECPTGGIYGTDGRVLMAPAGALENLKFNPKYKDSGLEPTLKGYLVAIHEAHTFWTPREASAVPPGVKVGANAPICRSLDRQRGNYFGDCKACSYRPFKDGKADKNACRNEDHLYFVLADFSGVYRVVVHGKSIGPGSAAAKKRSGPWLAYWEHAFVLSLKETTRGSEKWYELSVDVASTTFDPNAEESALLAVIARQVDYEVYLPQMYDIYRQPPRNTAVASSGAGEGTTDMSALLQNAGAAAGPIKDFSGSSNG